MSQNQKRTKFFALKVSICIVLSLIIAVLVFLFSWTGGRQNNEIFSIKVENSGIVANIDSYGYNSFKKTSGDFKVLQLTDIHYGNGLTKNKDRQALEAVKKLVENTSPDLIIVTGDLVYPMTFLTGSRNNLLALETVAEFMEGFEIPWTMTFGNHDVETFATHTKSQLCDYLETLEHCIFQRGPEEIDGLGNSFVNIYNSDNSLNTSIALFDSSSTINGVQLLGYETVKDSQVEWFKSETERMGKPSTFAFMHIPLKEYKTAWEKYRAGSGEVKYVLGKAGEKNEKISCSKESGKLFDTMVNLGNTKGIFSGHDHLNDFSIEYKGIRLTFAKSIDYLAYFGIYKKTEQRGATLLTIGDDEDFGIEHIKLSEI